MNTPLDTIDLDARRFGLRYSMRNLIEDVSQALNIQQWILVSKTRKREVVEARQIAMHIARKMKLAGSLQDIADHFQKDHATVLHAFRTVEALLETNPSFRTKYSKASNWIGHKMMAFRQDSSFDAWACNIPQL